MKTTHAATKSSMTGFSAKDSDSREKRKSKSAEVSPTPKPSPGSSTASEKSAPTVESGRTFASAPHPLIVQMVRKVTTVAPWRPAEEHSIPFASTERSTGTPNSAGRIVSVRAAAPVVTPEESAPASPSIAHWAAEAVAEIFAAHTAATATPEPSTTSATSLFPLPTIQSLLNPEPPEDKPAEGIESVTPTVGTEVAMVSPAASPAAEEETATSDHSTTITRSEISSPADVIPLAELESRLEPEQPLVPSAAPVMLMPVWVRTFVAATPSPSPTLSPSPSATPKPEPTPSPSPNPSVTPEPSATPTPEPSQSPSPSPTVTPEPSPTPETTATPTPSPETDNVSYTSVSTKVTAGSGENTAMTGFVLAGEGNTYIVVRALGPSLADAGVTDAIIDPTLVLYDSTGRVVAANDNWRDTQAADFSAGGHAASLQPGSELEPAIAASLPAGSYNIVVRGKNGTWGTAVIELYAEATAHASNLASVSTRARVETGDATLVSGVSLGAGHDNGSIPVVIRGLGPSLSALGLSNFLSDPVLNLYDGNGSLVATNDNWDRTGQLQRTDLAPSDPLEAAVALTLRPGNYTVILSGNNHGIGLGRLEIYFPLALPADN